MKEKTLEFLRKKTKTNTSSRYNEGKPQFSLIDYESITPMVRVLMFGEKKYGFGNWKSPAKEGPMQYIDSALRHLTAIANGELYDSESKLEHTGHVMANLMMFQYNVKDLPKNV